MAAEHNVSFADETTQTSQTTMQPMPMEEGDSSEESFFELTTTENESYSSSGEEDANRLQLVLERAYACSKQASVDPVLRSSALLQDKDLLTDDYPSEGRFCACFQLKPHPYLANPQPLSTTTV